VSRRLLLFLVVVAAADQVAELLCASLQRSSGLALGSSLGDALDDLREIARFLGAQLKAADLLGEAEVGVDARDHDADIRPQQLYADERDAREHVDHDSLVENRVDHIRERTLLAALERASRARLHTHSVTSARSLSLCTTRSTCGQTSLARASCRPSAGTRWRGSDRYRHEGDTMAIDVGKMINAATESALEDLHGGRRKRLFTPGRAIAVGAALAIAGRAAADPARRLIEERLGPIQDRLGSLGGQVEEPEVDAGEEELEPEEDEEPEAEGRRVSPPRPPSRPRRARQRRGRTQAARRG